MAAVSFDGRFFAISLDDGRRVLLLDAADNTGNASCRSLLQEQFEGFGQVTGQERPLAADIGRIVQEAAAAGRGTALAGDAAAALLLLKNLLTTPRAARLLFVGASVGSPCLRLVTAFLSEAVPKPVDGMPVRASISITAAAPLTDSADAAEIPQGVLLICTDLARMLLPREAFDLLLFDARGLAADGAEAAGLSEAELQSAVRRAVSVLAPEGFAVLLGPPALDVSMLDRVQSFPLAPDLALFLGSAREHKDVLDMGAEIRKERKQLGELLRSYLVGETELLAAIEGVRRYGELLAAHPADVPWHAERARAAQALEILVDQRLGQAAGTVQEKLRDIANLFTSSKK